MMKYWIVFCLLCLVASSCQKLELERATMLGEPDKDTYFNYIIMTSELVDISDEGVDDYGHCWSLHNSPSVGDYFTSNGPESKRISFKDTLFNLEYGRTYYVKPYAMKGHDVFYGHKKTIIVGANGIDVSLYGKEFLTSNTLLVKGRVSSLGSIHIKGYGHCWSQNPLPTIADDNNSFSRSDENEFYTTITGLEPGDTCYIRSFVEITDEQVQYSQVLMVVIPQLVITTDSYVKTGSTTATLFGTVHELGAIGLSDHGFVWSITTAVPTLNDNRHPMGPMNTTGQFAYDISGLETGVTYYFRAYGLEDNIVTYGSVLNFTN